MLVAFILNFFFPLFSFHYRQLRDRYTASLSSYFLILQIITQDHSFGAGFSKAVPVIRRSLPSSRPSHVPVPVLWLCISLCSGETSYHVISTHYGRSFGHCGQASRTKPTRSPASQGICERGSECDSPFEALLLGEKPRREGTVSLCTWVLSKLLHIHFLVIITTAPCSSQMKQPKGSLPPHPNSPVRFHLTLARPSPPTPPQRKCVPTPQDWPSSPFPGLPGHLCYHTCHPLSCFSCGLCSSRFLRQN